MVCDFVVLCCFHIGKNCCSLGIKTRFPYQFPFYLQVGIKSDSKMIQKCSEPLENCNWASQKNSLTNFVAFKRFQDFYAENRDTIFFSKNRRFFFRRPLTSTGTCSFETPIFLNEANCGCQLRRVQESKALVLPGSGRCYLSLGGARTEPMGPTRMAPLIFLVRNGVCEWV